MTAEGRHDGWQEEYFATKRCVDAMDLTYYGGRRDAVAPHKKHGARARRTTSTVRAFWVVLEGDARGRPLKVSLPDGKEAIALFSGEEEARMFCHFRQEEEEGASANIRQTTAGEVLSLLYCPWCAAKHVALDSFSEILGEWLLGLLTLDREDFARRFADGGSDPVALRAPWEDPSAVPLRASPSTN
jgi:hypothetical protein